MKIKSETLINELIDLTKQNITKIDALNQCSGANLNWRPTLESWSILETIEHLNLYGYFYLPEINSCIEGTRSQADLYFKSGLLGNYFAESMLPKEKLNKMKTFKDKDPIGSQLDKQVITECLKQQTQTIFLLNEARSVSLNRTKTAISISRWIKLKLGDTLRVVVYHNQRHLVQVENILKDS